MYFVITHLIWVKRHTEKLAAGLDPLITTNPVSSHSTLTLHAELSWAPNCTQLAVNIEYLSATYFPYGVGEVKLEPRKDE